MQQVDMQQYANDRIGNARQQAEAFSQVQQARASRGEKQDYGPEKVGYLLSLIISRVKRLVARGSAAQEPMIHQEQ